MAKLEPRTYQQIMDEMVVSLKTYAPAQFNVEPGSVMAILIGMIAEQLSIIEINFQELYISSMMNQVHLYPDGTPASGPPKDSDVYRFQSPQGEECYIYDAKTGWKWIGRKLNTPVEFIPISITITPTEELKCECGSEKSGSNRHSTWCKKFNPDL